MTKLYAIRPEFVDRLPKVLEDGVFYISEKFGTSAHNCCCGCGTKIVVPLKPGRWTLKQKNGRISVWPSIGNWSSVCQSHYVIRDNQIEWAGAMSTQQIAANREGDRLVRDRVHAERTWQESGFWGRLWIRTKKLWATIRSKF
jgi:hypothetical protein